MLIENPNQSKVKLGIGSMIPPNVWLGYESHFYLITKFYPIHFEKNGTAQWHLQKRFEDNNIRWYNKPFRVLIQTR